MWACEINVHHQHLNIFLYVFFCLIFFGRCVFFLINATCALFHMGNSDRSTPVESFNQFTWVNYGSLHISKPFSEPTLTVLMCNEGILATLWLLLFLHLNKVEAGWTPQVSCSSVNTNTVDFVSKCKLQRKVGIRTFSFRPIVSFALWLQVFAWDDPTGPESCVTRGPPPPPSKHRQGNCPCGCWCFTFIYHGRGFC